MHRHYPEQNERQNDHADVLRQKRLLVDAHIFETQNNDTSEIERRIAEVDADFAAAAAAYSEELGTRGKVSVKAVIDSDRVCRTNCRIQHPHRNGAMVPSATSQCRYWPSVSLLRASQAGSSG
jgi:hypothetical protein